MKKVLSLTLVLVVILSMFTACGTKGGEAKLSNPNANETTQAVYEYIKSIYGTNILTGQQESTWMDEGNTEYEMEFIEKATGKLPAIRGLDFMNDDFDGCVERAIDWWNKGGIVTICWHCSCYYTESWDACMNSEVSDWEDLFDENSEEYTDMLRGMDKAAKALKKLQDAGVTVLWRPFHEFDGEWFWWGKGGAENFKKLWQTMYDRYTNHWGLNNLIWVLGYSKEGKNFDDWYPGDKYVDIAGADNYATGSQVKLYNKVKKVVGDKMPIAHHECGTNPTVDELLDDGAKWAWFMTWHTEYLTDYNKPEALSELYNSDYAITLDELPKFTKQYKKKKSR